VLNAGNKTHARSIREQFAQLFIFVPSVAGGLFSPINRPPAIFLRNPVEIAPDFNRCAVKYYWTY
jgi:hypothetical protein